MADFQRASCAAQYSVYDELDLGAMAHKAERFADALRRGRQVAGV